MSPSIPAAQVLLGCCAVALIWASMSLRASKSRFLVIDNGKAIEISSFSLKVKLFHQFMQILLDFWVKQLISPCMTNILLINLLQKFCQVLI